MQFAMFLTIVIFLFVTTFTPIALWYLHWYKCMRWWKNIPGPKPWPIIGNADLFPDSKSVLSTLINLINEHGPLLKLIIGVEPSLTIADSKTLECVFKSKHLTDKSTQYRHFYNWLGQGLLTSGGNKWRQRRKIITPTYHFNILEQFVPIFDTVSNILIMELRKTTALCDRIDVYPFITLCALDIICETAMGTSVNAQINKDSDYVASVKEICKIIMDKTFRPMQQSSFLYKFTENYKREMKCLSIMNEYTNSIIKRRREELENGDAQHADDDRAKKVAFLDLLLQATVDGNKLTDDDVREEVATFMFEGHDTTASAMSFALYSLANNPVCQQKVVEEQIAIFGKNRDKSATHRDLNEMKYLEMVIKETLRLYPSVPFFARETKEEVKFDDGLTLPKGCIVNIFAYGVHRDPKYFPDPEAFNPDRFLPENQLGRSPYCFIPFSAGLRNCIGQKFAMLEMKATISKVVRHFQLSPAIPAHNLALISETILKSENGIFINMIQRNWENVCD